MNRDAAYAAILLILSRHIELDSRYDVADEILDAIWSDEHEHRWWSDSWGQWCQCGASILINPNNPRPA